MLSLTGIKLVVDHNFGVVSRFHRLCGRKLYQHVNLGFREPKPQKAAFDAAKSYNREDHERALGNLSEHQRRWIEAGGESSWARHSYDPSASCPQMKNIFNKDFNLWITELKCFPLCDLVMGFEAKLNQLFLRRQRNGRLLTDKHLVPRASTKLRDQIHNNIGYAALLDVYKPLTYIMMNEDHNPTRSVDLAQRKCDYDEWHISGVPCVHAVAVLATKRPPRYERYVDEYYTIGRYKVSYDGIISRMASINEWRQVTGANPPPLKEIWHDS
ncbi:hypothetical protein MKW98_000193 [Papaver atlanticum]|uniref:Zinc finger PMZ-type domain-containing protein n=1 Tax=Papaver atlanticum TaxID=357466 RepID=A0AAD4SRT0_9MAGN|nr:hypothetical protein MKW98_000193 [Papaver atlanticum]